MKSLSNLAKTSKVFPPGLNPNTVSEILEYAETHYFYFIHQTMKYKLTSSFMFNPKNLYGGVFELFCDIGWDLCEPTIWAIWCKSVQYYIPIALKTKDAYDILMNPEKEHFLFWTVLEWFSPLQWWRTELMRIMIFEGGRRIPNEEYPPLVSIFMVHRPYFQITKDYPLDESYQLQLATHLREMNSIKRSPADIVPDNLHRLIPSSSNGQQTRSSKTTTEYFLPEGTCHVEEQVIYAIRPLSKMQVCSTLASSEDLVYQKASDQ
ncbi:hypothetical protein CR513_45990, partial [Mucuna pruriens]